MTIPIFLIITPIIGFLSILMALWFARIVLQEDPGNEEMIKVSGYIERGANAFLRRQYVTLGIFVLCLAFIILFLPNPLGEYHTEFRVFGIDLNWEQSLSYLIGSAASMWAGWLGMIVGVKSNARTAQACRKGLDEGFDVAFFGGSVMGLATVGVALIGVPLLYYWIPDPNVILGFSFGASSIALFMKAGGGIYTKTADVAADLVGKAEYDLPEDDPRNPASIADNVGDNVGDIAGMGSDLFDSYVASIVAAMLLATAFTSIGRAVTATAEPYFIIYPLVLCGVGLLASLIGIILIKRSEASDPGGALNKGTYLATIIFAGFALVTTFIMTLTADITAIDANYLWTDYIAAMLGLGSGIVIGFTTDYFTRENLPPTKNIAESAREGHAVVILSGFAYGLLSVVPPALGIIVAMGTAYVIGDIFSVAMTAVGMLAVVGTIVTNDAYGPITDNARGVAEAGGLDEEVISIADKLDMAGNTAKAITKGFAIGAANLTVLALLFSFAEEARAIEEGVLQTINLLNMGVLIGAFIGVIAPALFSALLILSVQKNAAIMVDEIRRQFEEPEKGQKILDGEIPPDFEKCIDIATKGALKELILPSIISIAIPLSVGIILGIDALAAFLAGAILSGFVFAIFMANSGGSWDNAKKYIEDGHLGGKGTETHKASITGDTVGDPFKDTAGPSINTLLVVMSLTASMFVGIIMMLTGGTGLIIF